MLRRSPISLRPLIAPATHFKPYDYDIVQRAGRQSRHSARPRRRPITTRRALLKPRKPLGHWTGGLELKVGSHGLNRQDHESRAGLAQHFGGLPPPHVEPLEPRR